MERLAWSLLLLTRAFAVCCWCDLASPLSSLPISASPRPIELVFSDEFDPSLSPNPRWLSPHKRQDGVSRFSELHGTADGCVFGPGLVDLGDLLARRGAVVSMVSLGESVPIWKWDIPPSDSPHNFLLQWNTSFLQVWEDSSFMAQIELSGLPESALSLSVVSGGGEVSLNYVRIYQTSTPSVSQLSCRARNSCPSRKAYRTTAFTRFPTPPSTPTAPTTKAPHPTWSAHTSSPTSPTAPSPPTTKAPHPTWSAHTSSPTSPTAPSPPTTKRPTPNLFPSRDPTPAHTSSPTTKSAPSNAPSLAPSDAPSLAPSRAPSGDTTRSPTRAPSEPKTVSPTHSPSFAPSRAPSTREPSLAPSSSAPTKSPTTSAPTSPTTTAPSSRSPTHSPTLAPTTGHPTDTHSPTSRLPPSTSAPSTSHPSAPTSPTPQVCDFAYCHDRGHCPPTSSAPTTKPSPAPHAISDPNDNTKNPSHAPTRSPTRFQTHAPTVNPFPFTCVCDDGYYGLACESAESWTYRHGLALIVWLVAILGTCGILCWKKRDVVQDKCCPCLFDKPARIRKRVDSEDDDDTDRKHADDEDEEIGSTNSTSSSRYESKIDRQPLLAPKAASTSPKPSIVPPRTPSRTQPVSVPPRAQPPISASPKVPRMSASQPIASSLPPVQPSVGSLRSQPVIAGSPARQPPGRQPNRASIDKANRVLGK